MKKVIFGLLVLFIGSQLMTSCSSESNVLSQFSKRKYMKRFKAKDVKYKDVINDRENNLAINKQEKTVAFASNSAEVASFDMKEIVEIDNAELVRYKGEVASVDFVEPLLVDYSKNYRINNVGNSSKELFINNYSNNSAARSGDVNEVVLAILCIFIPPLAVFLYEDSITTNFWIDLIATLLFWLPGIIVAFLIVFGGVSF
jgi:uncharacterized membrane protein YqaE (UPF0057 family)